MKVRVWGSWRFLTGPVAGGRPMMTATRRTGRCGRFRIAATIRCRTLVAVAASSVARTSRPQTRPRRRKPQRRQINGATSWRPSSSGTRPRPHGPRRSGGARPARHAKRKHRASSAPHGPRPNRPCSGRVSTPANTHPARRFRQFQGDEFFGYQWSDEEFDLIAPFVDGALQHWGLM